VSSRISLFEQLGTTKEPLPRVAKSLFHSSVQKRIAVHVKLVPIQIDQVPFKESSLVFVESKKMPPVFAKKYAPHNSDSEMDFDDKTTFPQKKKEFTRIQPITFEYTLGPMISSLRFVNIAKKPPIFSQKLTEQSKAQESEEEKTVPQEAGISAPTRIVKIANCDFSLA